MNEKNPISLDTTEKMIRMEQNVAATFGNYITYDKTDCYKKMSPEERKKFEKYLENKDKKKTLAIFGLIVPVFLFALLKINVTGNAVRETIGTVNSAILGWIFIVMFIAGAALLLYKRSNERSINSKFANHSKVMENILVKKI